MQKIRQFKWLMLRFAIAVVIAGLSVAAIEFFYGGFSKTITPGKFKLKNGSVTADALISDASGPQLSYKNVNGLVNGVDIALNAPQNAPLKITVYYTSGLFQKMSLRQRINGTVPAGRLYFHIQTKLKFIKNIRVDFKGPGASKIALKSISMTRSMTAAERGQNRQRIYFWLALLFIVLLHIAAGPRRFYRLLFRFRYPAAGLLLVLLAAGGYSGSSVSEWDQYVQPSVKPVYAEPIVGVERSIRSDEWLVATPFMLSQKYSSHPYSYINDVMRAEPTDAFVITDTPVRDIVGVAHPFLTGFLLFGQRAGLSLFWYGRLLALLLSSFELMRLITKDRRILSLAGALLVTFGPPVQWWFSTGLPDMLIYGQAAIVLVYYFLNTDKRAQKILCGAGLSVCALGYTATFYPAWQVPFFYVFGALLVWILIENFKNRRKSWFDLAVILAAALFTAAILARVFMLSYDTIKIVSQTAYPGKQFKTGGGGINKLFMYFINPLFPYKNPGNPSEYSDFITFFPIPLVASLFLIIKNWKQKKDVFLICSTAVSTVLLLWAAVSWPGFLAKASLLYMSGTLRTVLALELVQCYILIRVIAGYGPGKLFSRPWAAGIAAACAVCVAIIAKSYLHGYAGTPYLVAAAVVMFAVGYLVLYGGANIQAAKLRHAALTVLLIGIAVSAGMFVNPVVKGLNAIYAKPAAAVIQKAQHDRPGVWLALNESSLVLQQFAIANGAPTINSVNAYPALSRWMMFDPKRMNVKKYNRYAHILINLTNSATSFDNIGSPDILRIKLNADDLKKLKVNYLISDMPAASVLPYANSSVKIRLFYAEDGVYLYHVQ